MKRMRIMSIDELLLELPKYAPCVLGIDYIYVYDTEEDCANYGRNGNPTNYFIAVNLRDTDASVKVDWAYLHYLSFQKLQAILSIIKKFKDTPHEDRIKEKKYTVQVVTNSAYGYLIVNNDTLQYELGKEQVEDHVSSFSKSELDIMKTDPKLCIDWNKAKIEEVTKND